MRSFFLLIIFLIPSFVFAACPNGNITSNQTAETISAAINSSGIAKDRITTNTTGTQRVFKNGAWVDVDVYEACLQPTPVTCQSPMVKTPGQFGVNYSCKPPPCPATHPNSAANGTQCKDSNGCTQDQILIAGACVNKKSEEILQRCVAAASSTGGVGTLVVPSDGSSPTCIVGAAGSGTAAACTSAPGGTACVVNGLTGGPPGYQCGSVNGASVCVASSETNAVGTSSTPVGGPTSSPGTPKTTEEQVSAMGQTTTTTRTVIPDIQQTTTVNDSSPVSEGQQVDSGAGSAGVPPITCSNGMKAANVQSCDTNTVCPPDSYAAYGACIKSPTRTTSVIKENTTTTVTVKNDSTGQTVSQNQSTSSTSTPIKVNSGSGAVQDQIKGQCDPTAKNYQECVGLLQTAPDSQVVIEFTNAGNTALTTATDAQNSSINSTTAGLGTNTTTIRNMANSYLFTSATCSVMTINIGPISKTLDCTRFVWFKSAFGWFIFFATVLYMMHLFFKPVER